MRPQLLDAPAVQRIAEAGAQAPAGQAEPLPLMVGRAAPRPRQRCTARRTARAAAASASVRAWPSRASSSPRSCLTAFGSALAVARAEDAIDRGHRLAEARRQAARWQCLQPCSPRSWNSSFQRCAGSSAAMQCTSSVPTSVSVAASSHRRISRRPSPRTTVASGGSACASRPARSTRSPARGGAWPASSAVGRDDVKAHRLADAQREAAAVQAQFVAFLAALRQQADAGAAMPPARSSRRRK